jgi:hypothetical protein
MRLFTLVAGSQRVLTVNASDVQEAMDALSTLLGDVDALTIRNATPDEAMAWNASAMQAEMGIPSVNTLGGSSRCCSDAFATGSLPDAKLTNFKTSLVNN